MLKAKKYYIVLVILLIIFGCNKSDDINIQIIVQESVFTTGGSNNERAESVTSTIDGGFAVLGFTQSNDGDVNNKVDTSYDYWFLKYDNQGLLQWQKNLGGSSNDRGRELIQTEDGGYALIGSSFSSDGDISENSGQSDFWLVKLDASGNVNWQKAYGFEGNDEGMSIIQTNDNGFLLIGVLDVSASGGEGVTSKIIPKHAGGDYWAVKVDALGNLQWSNYYGGNFTDSPEDVVQTDDGGYIIVGESDSEDTDISNSKGSYDYWVIRITSVGELLWERSFGGTEIDQAKAIVKSNDGNYMIVGNTRSDNTLVSNNNGGADIWLIKIDPNGNLIWETSYGGSNFDSARDLFKTNDGYLIAGNSRSSNGDLSENNGQNDVWVLKLDFHGSIQWDVSIGGSAIDLGYGITKLQNGNIFCVGETSSSDGDILENKGFTDLLLIKIQD